MKILQTTHIHMTDRDIALVVMTKVAGKNQKLKRFTSNRRDRCSVMEMNFRLKFNFESKSADTCIDVMLA